MKNKDNEHHAPKTKKLKRNFINKELRLQPFYYIPSIRNISHYNKALDKRIRLPYMCEE